MHAIQLEVLLSNYFFLSRRFLEGRYHCLAAVALAIGNRLHQLSSTDEPNNTVAFCEKVRAIWTVYILDNCWAVALDSPPSFLHNGTILTPWLPSETTFPQGETAVYGVMRPVLNQLPGYSFLALRAEAAALYQIAMWLTSQYQPDMPIIDGFNVELLNLDQTIDHFTSKLLLVECRNPEDARDMLVLRTTVCVATIQLHRRFIDCNPGARQRCTAAANSAADVLATVDISQLEFSDPIVSILWIIVCKTLVGEVVKLKQLSSNDVDLLTRNLDRIAAVMAILSGTSPLMRSQYDEVQQMRANCMILE